MEKELNKEDQIKKIQEIMGTPEEVPFYRFNFGKYKGDTLEEVYKSNKQYLVWLYNNVDDLSPKLEKFIVDKLIN